MSADGLDGPPILLLANGNLNGRVTRLVADDLQRRRPSSVRLITIDSLSPLTVWPEERTQPHLVSPQTVTLADAEHLVTTAAAFVLPPSWDPAARRLIAIAKRSGTPVICVVADVAYGAHKFDASDIATLPDHVCVADPITREALLRIGIPERVIRHVGSPYLDVMLERRLSPIPNGALTRIAMLASPNGVRERRANRRRVSPDGVLSALAEVMERFPDARLTVRLHPRQNMLRVVDAFPLPPRATFDHWQPQTTLHDFVQAHQLVVGSYSLGLVVARMLGRPAVSYQPFLDDDGQRRELFAAWDVPVATNPHELADTIERRLGVPCLPLPLQQLLYEPGRSLCAIAHMVSEAAASSRRSRQTPRLTTASAQSTAPVDVGRP